MSKFRRLLGSVLFKFRPRLRLNFLGVFGLRLQGYHVNPNARICNSSYIKGSFALSIGSGTFIGDKCHITGGKGRILIGNNCDISDRVIITCGTHVISSSNRRAGEGVGKDVVIGDGCWIGIGAVLLPGCHIGAGSIIGGGTVVRGRVPDNSIVVGSHNCLRELS